MLKTLWEKELDAELIATLLFMILSGFYIITVYGFTKVMDTLLLWMFPASVMVFLTLLIARIIERWHERKVNQHRYVDWRR
ncbi:MAG: hypothetical protein AABW63_01650 [Nanoarchaeota archaeon]